MDQQLTNRLYRYCAIAEKPSITDGHVTWTHVGNITRERTTMRYVVTANAVRHERLVNGCWELAATYTMTEVEFALNDQGI